MSNVLGQGSRSEGSRRLSRAQHSLSTSQYHTQRLISLQSDLRSIFAPLSLRKEWQLSSSCSSSPSLRSMFTDILIAASSCLVRVKAKHTHIHQEGHHWHVSSRTREHGSNFLYIKYHVLACPSMSKHVLACPSHEGNIAILVEPMSNVQCPRTRKQKRGQPKAVPSATQSLNKPISHSTTHQPAIRPSQYFRASELKKRMTTLFLLFIFTLTEIHVHRHLDRSIIVLSAGEGETHTHTPRGTSLTCVLKDTGAWL